MGYDHALVSALNEFMSFLAEANQYGLLMHDPERMRAFTIAAEILFEMGAYDRSCRYYFTALRLQYPNLYIFWIDSWFAFKCNVSNWHLMASFARASRMTRDYKEAISGYEKALEVCDDDGAKQTLRHDLARLLATCPDEELCDGQRAVKITEQLVRDVLEEGDVTDLNWRLADTLAAAYARADNYDGALNWIENAKAICRKDMNSDLTWEISWDPYFKGIQARYMSKKPYQEQPHVWLEIFDVWDD